MEAELCSYNIQIPPFRGVNGALSIAKRAYLDCHFPSNGLSVHELHYFLLPCSDKVYCPQAAACYTQLQASGPQPGSAEPGPRSAS